MIYYLFYSLKDKFSFLNLLRYITFRSAMAFFTAFIIGIIIAPYFIRKFKEIGAKQTIRLDGPETHLKKNGTPTMGGIFIIISSLISIFLWTIINNYVLAIVITILLFGFIGFLDDYRKITFKNTKGISANLKLILQFIFSLIVILFLYITSTNKDFFFKFYFPFITFPIFTWPLILGFIFYIFTITAFSNATNLSDGLDGLAAGMSISLYIPFGVIAYASGNFISAQYLLIPYIPGTGELSVVISAMIGGFTAFLWYNVHPAEIFMGDTGSLSIGAAIAVIAIILKHELILLIAGAIFVLETLSVIIQTSYFKYTKKKTGTGKRFFLMAPIHHHFEKKGWKETQVVIRFWILSALCALISLMTLKIR